MDAKHYEDATKTLADLYVEEDEGTVAFRHAVEFVARLFGVDESDVEEDWRIERGSR